MIIPFEELGIKLPGRHIDPTRPAFSRSPETTRRWSPRLTRDRKHLMTAPGLQTDTSAPLRLAGATRSELRHAPLRAGGARPRTHRTPPSPLPAVAAPPPRPPPPPWRGENSPPPRPRD